MSDSIFDLDIPIFTKTYELYKTFYGYLSSFPKKDKYAFGLKCESLLLEVIEGIILAGNQSKHDKLPTLNKVSSKLDVLKVMFRLGKDLKIIDNKKYLILEGIIQEIGRMLGGWIKATSNQM